jgi:hypothetical protein
LTFLLVYDILPALSRLFPDRLTAGHQVLVLSIGVRIPVREPTKRPQFICGLFVGSAPAELGHKLFLIGHQNNLSDRDFE